MLLHLAWRLMSVILLLLGTATFGRLLVYFICAVETEVTSDAGERG